MNQATSAAFEDEGMHAWIDAQDDATLDRVGFGIIGFDVEGVVRLYNAVESRLAGVRPARVLGHGLLTVVAPCLNNFMVAQRFDDALAEGTPLDAILAYVLTLRMKPEKVRLRLLASPRVPSRYVLIERHR